MSRKLYDYELALRDWERGGPDSDLSRAAGGLRATVSTALGRVRRDPAGNHTAVARGLLEDALRARLHALDALLAALAAEHSSGIVHAPPTSYVRAWNDSIVYARKGLTKLQDVRDRARLIPIPEDSVS